MAALFSMLICAPAANATVIVPASLAELSSEATSIVRGRVASVDARWTDDHRSIETLVTIDVEHALKGAPGRFVQFAVPGGLLGRYRTVVLGAPSFVVDEHVIVFLGGRAPALPHVVGFSQGVFRVVAESGSRAPHDGPPGGTARTAVIGSAGGPAPSADGGAAAPLEAFEARVRALTDRSRARVK